MSQAAAIALEKDKQPMAELALYRVVELPKDCHLPALVSQMLGHFDGKTTLAEVCQKGQISPDRAESIVRKLTHLGILETVAVPETETKMSEKQDQAFTAEEEAFFASEVEPIDECDEPFESVGEKVSLFFSELILRLRGNPVF
jgi:hypothetical protein